MFLRLGEHLLRSIFFYANKVKLEHDNIINVLAINIQKRSFSSHTFLRAIALKVELNFVNNTSLKFNKVKQNIRRFLLPPRFDKTPTITKAKGTDKDRNKNAR